MIYLYMLIIWEVETYPGVWASALIQPIYKGGGKDRHSLVFYRGIYLFNTLTKLFEGLMEHVFLNSQNSMTPLPPLSRGHESPDKPMTLSTRLLPPYKSDSNTDSPAAAV